MSQVFGSEEYYCGHIAKRVDKVLQCQEKLLDIAATTTILSILLQDQ